MTSKNIDTAAESGTDIVCVLSHGAGYGELDSDLSRDFLQACSQLTDESGLSGMSQEGNAQRTSMTVSFTISAEMFEKGAVEDTLGKVASLASVEDGRVPHTGQEYTIFRFQPNS